MLVCTASSGGADVGDVGALFEVVHRGGATQAASLFERKVKVDAPSANGSTPPSLAIANDHLVVARQSIETGADVNRQNSRLDSPYPLAGVEGHLEILRLTLLRSVDLESTSRYGDTVLVPTCKRGHVEVVKTLLQVGVDPNHVSKFGWTGLFKTILLNDDDPRHQKTVRLLIDTDADANLADADGVSPLAHARQRGQGGIE